MGSSSRCAHPLAHASDLQGGAYAEVVGGVARFEKEGAPEAPEGLLRQTA